MDKHIVTLGGGGWMMGEIPSQLDHYILDLAGKKKPKVCYVPTATGDADEVIERFYASGLSDNLDHFQLFKPTLDWKTKLQDQDIIYVGGGNTRSMLAIWREWGIDNILRECYDSGVILCGMSAGAICWFDKAITDSDPNEYTIIDGLGLLEGLAAAHFSRAGDKEELFDSYASKNRSKPCYGMSDFSAIHFVNGRLEKCIYSEKDAQVVIRNSPNM